MSPVPFGRRDRLTSAVGPDGSGSNPGSPCTQSPEKSGMDTALSSPLPASPTAGATAWPKAGVTTAAASVNTKGKFRHCESIAFLLLSLRSAVSSRIRLHPLPVRLEGGGVRPWPEGPPPFWDSPGSSIAVEVHRVVADRAGFRGVLP